MADSVMEVKRRLLLLLKDPEMVKAYLHKYGPVINAKNINDIKYGGKGGMSTMTTEAARAAIAAAARGGKPAPAADTQEGAGSDDPIYEMQVNCPICGQSKIMSYELRAKSQQILQTIFLVPMYSGTSGYKTVDYTRLAIAVCPGCLFASPDKKNFNYPSASGKGEEVSTLPVNAISALKDTMDERKKILPAALNNPAYFARERSVNVAIESYLLAMERAKVEAELLLPYSYFKLGSYLLKIAYLKKCNGEDDTETLAEALKYLEKSFLQSECPNEELEMQVLYLNVALNLRLGDQTKAHSYIAVFAKLLTERTEAKKKNPSLTSQWIEKWQDKAKFLWDERDNAEYFTK